MSLYVSDAAGDAQSPTTPQGLFDRQLDGRLIWKSSAYSAEARPGWGWHSLRIGGDEFLHQIGFEHAGTWIDHFPDSSNISHDQTLAHRGSVSDGIFLIEFRPSFQQAEALEIYAGHNTPGEAQLVVLLHSDVVLIRRGAGSGPRSAASVVNVSDKPQQLDGAMLVHKSGRTLIVHDRCTITTRPASDGSSRIAISFPTKGFEPNQFRFTCDPVARAANLVSQPQFQVNSDADPDKGLGATRGVKNPIYSPHTQATWSIRFNWHGQTPFTGQVGLDVVHALGRPHFQLRVEVNEETPSVKGRYQIALDPRFDQPGVSEVWGRIVDADGHLVWVDRFRMLWDYEQFQPDLLVQEDHRQFWTQTLEALRAHPLDPQTRRVDEYADHPEFEIYEVSFNGWEGKRFYAMMFVPRQAKRPLPAIVTSHPGTRGFNINRGPDGVYGSRLGHDPRFVTIQPLIRGHRPDEKDLPFNHPWWGPLDDRDTYVARAWYTAMVRAIDYLATRDDLVDMNRIVTAGGSQGGALAVVTAALDDRVAYCFADCPSNAQPHEMLRGLYGSFGPSAGQVPPGQSIEQVERMLSYYNPVNFAPWIKCPTYVGSNVGDLTVHHMGPLAIYRNLTALGAEDKAFYPGFTHFHGSGAGLAQKRREIYERIAGPLPVVKK